VTFTASLVYIWAFADVQIEVFNLMHSCSASDVQSCTDESAQFVTHAAIGLVISFGGLCAAAILQSSMRYFGALSLPQALGSKSGEFALYLRPFDTDDIILQRPKMPFVTALLSFRPFPARIEEELFDVADGFLPLVAIGRPTQAGSRSRADLAHRAFVSNEEWQPYVHDLIRRPAAIVMVLRQTDGVTWELEKLIDEHATVFSTFLAARSASLG
jgi:hypothetical protein